MGIGYFQLTIISENDKYIIGNPQFTYFKAVYKRHTNFAIENMMLNFTGETYMSANSNFGKKMYCVVPKNGDLLHRMYLVVDMENNSLNDSQIDIDNELSVTAHSLIDYIEVRIGDQLIDRHTGEWLHMFSEVFTSYNKNSQLCEMINLHNSVKGTHDSNKYRDGLVYIPLQFWFNRNAGLSIPLLALQYADVKIDVKFTSRDKLYNLGSKKTVSIRKVNLLTEYIHLDREEKNLFASNSHEYLIEQVQDNLRNVIPLQPQVMDKDYESYQHKIELAFNHPVKELFWGIQDKQSKKSVNGDSYSATRKSCGNNIFNFWRNLDSFNRGQQIIDATIMLNGKELFEPRAAQYFMSVMRYQYHSGFGYADLNVEKNNGSEQNDVKYSTGSGFYCYSFALDPEKHQPSGTLNFSKLDRAELRVRVKRDPYNFTNSNTDNIMDVGAKMLKIYAINYNVLRIMGGQGGLAFQN